MLLEAPFEYKLRKLIKETLEEAEVSQLKGAMPSTVDMKKMGQRQKMKVRSAYKSVTQEPAYSNAKKAIDNLFVDMEEVSQAVKSASPETVYWYLGLMEKLLRTVSSNKAAWAAMRDSVKGQLENANQTGDEAGPTMRQSKAAADAAAATGDTLRTPTPQQDDETGAFQRRGDGDTQTEPTPDQKPANWDDSIVQAAEYLAGKPVKKVYQKSTMASAQKVIDQALSHGVPKEKLDALIQRLQAKYKGAAE